MGIASSKHPALQAHLFALQGVQEARAEIFLTKSVGEVEINQSHLMREQDPLAFNNYYLLHPACRSI